MALQMTEEEFISLGIEVQDAGFNALNQHLGNVETHIQSVGAAVESVNQISEVPLEKLTDHFSQTNKQIQETNASLDKLRAGLGDMPDLGDEEGGGGGGLGGVSGLRRTGGALTQLGLGEIGRPVQLIGDLQQISKTFDQLSQPVEDAIGSMSKLVGGMAPLGAIGLAAAAGVAIVALVINDLNEKAKIAEQELKAFGSATEKTSSIIAEGTQATLKAASEASKDSTRQADIVAQDIQHIRDRATQGGGALAQDVAGLTDQQILKSNLLRGTYADLFTSIDKATQAQQEDITTFNQLASAISKGSTIAADATISEKALQDARDKTANKNIQDAVQTDQLERTGTSKSVQDRIASIEAEKKAILDELGTQQVSLDKRIELTRRVSELSNEEDKLTNTVLPLVQAREAEDKAAKDTKKALDDITKAHEAYEKSIQSAKDSLNNQIQTAKQREALAEEANTPGSLQDTEQREKIRLDEGRKETQLAQESADRLVDIRAKEGQDEQHVQVDLQREFADDVTKFQEQQQTDALNHEQRLAQIKSDAQDAELDDIANRDFAKLAQDQEGAKKQESQEDQKFAQQEQQLAVHLQQEEKQQQIAAQRRLDDLRTAEAFQEQEQQIAAQRKLDALRQSEQYQLDDLTTAEGYKIQILRVGLQNEISLYQQQEQQRLQIAQQTQAAIIASAQQQIARLNPTGSAILDLGGTLNDQLAQMFSQ
jgi:hypothetical protein